MSSSTKHALHHEQSLKTLVRV